MSEVIYYPRESGGYMFDYYSEGWEEGMFCDNWGKAATEAGLMEMINIHYPDAKLTQGVTGRCPECGGEYFDLEKECMDCEVELYE